MGNPYSEWGCRTWDLGLESPAFHSVGGGSCKTCKRQRQLGAETAPGASFESWPPPLPGLWEPSPFSNPPGKACGRGEFPEAAVEVKEGGTGRRVAAVRKCSAAVWAIQVKGALGSLHERTKVLGLQKEGARKEGMPRITQWSKAISLKWAEPALNFGSEIFLTINSTTFYQQVNVLRVTVFRYGKYLIPAFSLGRLVW